MKTIADQLHEERKRSGRYFERMKRVEGNLALIREELGIPGRQQAATISHIRGMQETIDRLIEAQTKAWAEEAHEKMFEPKETPKDTAWLIYHLLQLADGCKEHPAYRQYVPPRVKCERCERLWQLRQRYPR